MAQVVTAQPGMQTTVVVQQSGTVAYRDWNSSLFSCFDDIGSCLIGFLCPCILTIQVSQRMGEGCCFACCCQGAPLALRAKLRTEQHIQGSLCNDAIIMNFCGVCAMCQMSRELNALGR
ncbi:cornifelin homolog [Exaiptasia diaphana]|uniref:Cornifelin n=1 Tax=Exaiptasia diaphana TaxID=2652724 RepID=A0A913X5A3_EXADI|nr:cornifelin homolog [Exaiptasia diaphana]KXJ15112.1 Cornifelin-like [Exaiptasia diaphana]